MKAISVKQPFAALIAAGIKQFETRKWKTAYRGPLLVHASLALHPLFVEYDFATETLELDNFSTKRWYTVNKHLMARSGEMMCVVDLVDVQPFEDDKSVEDLACCDWYGGYVWKLENPKLTFPIPLKGKLGIFDVPDELIKYVKLTKQV